MGSDCSQGLDQDVTAKGRISDGNKYPWLCRIEFSLKEVMTRGVDFSRTGVRAVMDVKEGKPNWV